MSLFKTVLIVEDDVDIANTLKVLIETKGYICGVAHSAVEAVAKLHIVKDTERPCLILTDLTMPENGHKLIDYLSNLDVFAVIPVVVVSGNGGFKGMKHIRKFIAKPFNIDNILNIVDQFCGQPESSLCEAIKKIDAEEEKEKEKIRKYGRDERAEGKAEGKAEEKAEEKAAEKKEEAVDEAVYKVKVKPEDVIRPGESEPDKKK